MPTFIVTGASSGLGLAIARELGRSGDHRVVLAVRDQDRGRSAARAVGTGAEVRRVDLASLADVRRFAMEWSGPIAGLVNNAGVQQTDRTRRTVDGWEETIAVNHLAAFALTVALLPWLAGGRVLFIGSATHDPRDRMAARFGFRGARFTTVAALARGEVDGRTDQERGRNRYATSKFLNMVTAAELARRIPSAQTGFFTLDPGMMPGTGLARTAPGWQRILWSTLLRWAGPLLGASSPARSARAAARLLLDADLRAPSGGVLSFDGEPSAVVWPPALDPAVGGAVVDQTLELLGLSPGLRPAPPPPRSAPPPGTASAAPGTWGAGGRCW